MGGNPLKLNLLYIRPRHHEPGKIENNEETQDS
jgi:hypothetical protein